VKNSQTGKKSSTAYKLTFFDSTSKNKLAIDLWVFSVSLWFRGSTAIYAKTATPKRGRSEKNRKFYYYFNLTFRVPVVLVNDIYHLYSISFFLRKQFIDPQPSQNKFDFFRLKNPKIFFFFLLKKQ
jgi:hypothetical protein